MNPARLFAILLFTWVVAITGSKRAAAAGQDSTVAVKVGQSELTVADVERRLKGVPPFQLTTFGGNPDEIRKNFVEKVLVPELLLSEEAKARRLDMKPDVRDQIRKMFSQALEKQVSDGISEKKSVSADEVRSYFEQNRSRFETPRRIRIWRILVPNEDLAKKILGQVKGTDAPRKWAELAREDSLDKATNLRSGDLGFVRADGTTDAPRVRADPALFAAADKVKDGELVPQPVKEGEHFAVIWRRGSMAAVTRTLEQEESSIRLILSRKKLDDSRTALIDDLRQKYVRDVNDGLLNYVDVTAFGDVGARQRPGILPRHRPTAPPAPSAGEQGLR